MEREQKNIWDTISNDLQMSFFIAHHLFQEYIETFCAVAYFSFAEIWRLRCEMGYSLPLGA